jgi:hypothetical protein
LRVEGGAVVVERAKDEGTEMLFLFPENGLGVG